MSIIIIFIAGDGKVKNSAGCVYKIFMPPSYKMGDSVADADTIKDGRILKAALAAHNSKTGEMADNHAYTRFSEGR